ncbi:MULTISPECIES: hypothetical protein [Salinibaculum]|uniref:hypothetical protein n=1 Tax=Salinibaculum TaxID=2732368 RepID=UPI0030D0824A
MTTAARTAAAGQRRPRRLASGLTPNRYTPTGTRRLSSEPPAGPSSRALLAGDEAGGSRQAGPNGPDDG